MERKRVTNPTSQRAHDGLTNWRIVMVWWPIAGFLIFLTGLVIVGVHAIRHAYKSDDKSDKSTRS